MKSVIYRFISKFSGTVAALALMVTVMNANSACFWIGHQPELPEKAKRLRKF